MENVEIKEPLKVGYIIGSLYRGGTETHLSELMIEMKSRGHEVSVFVVGPHGSVADVLAEHQIVPTPREPIQVSPKLPVWARRILRMLLLVGPLYKFALQHRKGIIHIFLPETVIGCGAMLQPWRRRMILSQRGMMTYRARYPKFFAQLERFVLSRGARVLANSIPVRDELVGDGVPEKKIQILHNGLSEGRLSPPETRSEMRELLGIDDDALVFAKLANLHPYKGYEDLIDALGILKQGGRLPEKWVLLCIGGELAPIDAQQSQQASKSLVLKERAEKFGIASHLRFLGAREDAPSLLRAADLGIHASHEEGFSNAILEMMGAGLAVVATDVGGAREALIPGVDEVGILVPRCDPEALAKALDPLVENKGQREKMGKLARARAVSAFSIETCVDNYEQAYREVLSR